MNRKEVKSLAIKWGLGLPTPKWDIGDFIAYKWRPGIVFRVEDMFIDWGDYNYRCRSVHEPENHCMTKEIASGEELFVLTERDMVHPPDMMVIALAVRGVR